MKKEKSIREYKYQFIVELEMVDYWDGTKTKIETVLSEYGVNLKNARDKLYKDLTLPPYFTIIKEISHARVNITDRKRSQVYKGFPCIDMAQAETKRYF